MPDDSIPTTPPSPSSGDIQEGDAPTTSTSDGNTEDAE